GVVGLNSNEKLDLQDMRQLPVIEPLVKKAFCCQRTERIHEYIDMSYRIASSGCPGPVYLEIPIDVWNGEVDESSVKKVHTVTDANPVDLEKTNRFIELLENAEKPMVIGGSGSYYSGAEKEFAEFIEKTGSPGFTSALGRGLIADTHPLCFESSTLIRPGAAFDALVAADMIILLGNRISLYYAHGEVFNPEAKIVQVDIAQEEIGRNCSVDLGIVSDIKAFMAEACRIIDKKGIAESLKSTFSPWIEFLKEKEKYQKDMAGLNWESSNTPIHHMRICSEIDKFMDRRDDIVVSDGGDTQVWMSMTRTMKQSGHYLESGIFGCLGVGLPYAQAAKLLYPDKRVCLVTGDGSIGFNFMEFETCIRKNLPVVVVICNDKQWGMIRHAQEVKLGRCIKEGCEIGMVDYHKAVEAFGGHGSLVENPDDIPGALEEAFASGVVSCINIITDPVPISPGSLALAQMGGFDVSKFME
ncbi:MAG: thiamine pyrophosphate-binding protein, partial [Deltaproteobacteria bacterium]|nr:thiamine pyrophosphate-binding protein [Deltaproteobacteria bacterium]